MGHQQRKKKPLMKTGPRPRIDSQYKARGQKKKKGRKKPVKGERRRG